MGYSGLKMLKGSTVDENGNLVIDRETQGIIAKEYSGHSGHDFKAYQEALAQILAAKCGVDNVYAQ